MRTLIALLLCCPALALRPCSAASGPVPGPLTLGQTIDAVLAQYPSLEAARAAVDAAAGRTARSDASRGLQATLGGGYTYMSLRPYVAIGNLAL